MKAQLLSTPSSQNALVGDQADPAPLVVLSGIRKWFGKLEVLRGVDLTVARGEVVCMLGPSGSGKSTLLRCINYLEQPTEGFVTIDGKIVGAELRRGRLRESSEKEISRMRADVGMVFQNFNLFRQKTAIQNIVEGPIQIRRWSKKDAYVKARDLLERVGLSDKANSYPQQLSGGQQQRVAIARALAMEPILMLFDEPTSALDPELVGDVLDVIKDVVSDGMTTIIVTHEIGFARKIADTVYLMDEGVIIEAGSPAEVLENPTSERGREFISRVLH